MTTTRYQPAHQHLVGDDTWERVTHKIAHSAAVRGLGVDHIEHLPERIFDQTLAFLLCCGTHEPGEGPFSATPYIDEGWHSFILHLKPYLDFCEATFGKTVWHNPYNVSKDFDAARNMQDGCVRSKTAMAKRGLRIDEPVWALPYHGFSLGNCDDACSWAYLDGPR